MNALLHELVVVGVFSGEQPFPAPYGFDWQPIPDGIVVTQGMIFLNDKFNSGNYSDFLNTKRVDSRNHQKRSAYDLSQITQKQ